MTKKLRPISGMDMIAAIEKGAIERAQGKLEVYAVIQEVEVGAERDEILGLYRTKYRAEQAVLDMQSEHTYDEEEGDDPKDRDWCECCDPAYSFKIEGPMEVI